MTAIFPFARSAFARSALALLAGLLAGSLQAAPLPVAVGTMLRNSGLPLASFGIDVQPIDGAASPASFALNAEQPFLLASTTKLVTSLAALDLLGANHRWLTSAHATGPLADGRLSGDLVIAGGEVGLTAGEMRRWFMQMRSEGLLEVSGNIVLEHVALLHERDPAQVVATSEERVTDGPIDGRIYNLGKLLVSVQPSSGERATIVVKPRPANVTIVNDVAMGGGTCAAWARWRTAEESRGGAPLQLWVRGRWDASCAADDIAYVQPPPGVRLAPELGAAPALPIAAPRLVADLWREAGGKLRGRVIENTESAGLQKVVSGRWSSEVASPLVEVLREMNKTSNNAAARSVLLALAGDVSSRLGMLSSA
ncbi:MAG: D-alanyl-D-alanine carboxypeptidase, partial [Caldimonas sp.]